MASESGFALVARQDDQDVIVLLIADKHDALQIAAELRQRGQWIEVRPYDHQT